MPLSLILLVDIDGMGSESSIWNRQEASEFALHPRASVESLGGMVSVDNSGYSSGGGSVRVESVTELQELSTSD
jgi:hypothetical protein